MSVLPISQPSSHPHPSHVPQSYEPSKPVIPRMIAIHRSLGETGDLTGHCLIDQLEHQHQQLDIWTKKEIQRLQELANRSWVEQAWSYLNVITSSVTAVVTLVAGTYLIAGHNEPLLGSVLVVAGVSNILQNFFSNLGMIDWISEALAEKNQALKDRLKSILPLMLFMFNLTFSILSQRGYASLVSHKMLFNSLRSVQAYLSMTTQAGQSYLSLRKGWSDAQHTKIQGHLAFHEQNIDFVSRLLEHSMEEMKRIKSSLKKPILSLMQAGVLAAQKI